MEVELMAPFFLVVGIGGSVLIWDFGIRPLVVLYGKGYKTGANIGIAVWVDWQTCREIGVEEDDGTARVLGRAFMFCQASAILGVCIGFASA